MNPKGQMSILIIIGIVIVAGIILLFAFREKIFGIEQIPSELQPVFSYYESCIKNDAENAMRIAGTQGGYIRNIEYRPGSEYAPFSSELNFLGFSVPYWFYISGNGLAKEQVPSLSEIERNIGDYVEERLGECDFSLFLEQGYSIEKGDVNVNVNVEEQRVIVGVDSRIFASIGESGATKNKYEIVLDSKLGKFYGIAREIYAKQKEDAIFESYAFDTLRLYAPVDGVEISCSGKIWKTREVIDELKEGLEANIGEIKFKGNYYSLNERNREYYVVDLDRNVDENINLIYSRALPTKIEINGEGVDDELMIASPVGIQEGLGVLGFCYAPYHFVYDLSFPVIVQIYNNDEIFQFPVVSFIDNNIAREGIFSEIEAEEESFDLCEYMTQDISVSLYDNNLNSVDGNLSYQCFNQRCKLGESRGGAFAGKAPACLNGEIIVRAEGFAEKSERFSTNINTNSDIILERVYEVDLELEVGQKELEGTAIILFSDKEGETTSTLLPDEKRIRLKEGDYSVTVYVYGNSSISIPASKRTQCQEAPRSGILGFFGSTKEECFDINIPETKIEFALRGGGKGENYLLAEQLERGKLKINVDELPIPKSLEELQYNYASFEEMGVDIE